MSELEKLQRMVIMYRQQISQLLHENISMGVEIEYLNEQKNLTESVKLNHKGDKVEEK